MAVIFKSKIFLLAVSAALALALVFGVYSLYMETPSETVLPTTAITVGGVALEVELAVSEAEHEQGLSNRKRLSEGKGMLFVFETEDAWGIWMKDMLFPIDIIWADANGRIVTVKSDVSPDTYPEAFYPSSPAGYVLEVPAGFAGKHGIAEGDRIVVQ